MKEVKGINFKRNTRIFFELVKHYKLYVFIILLAITILEFIGIVDKYLLKLVIDNGVKFAEGTILQNNFIQILTIIALVFLGNIFLKSIIVWINFHFVNLLESRLILDIKRKFFNHLIGLHHGFYTHTKTGSIISKLLRGGRAVESISDSFIFNFLPLIIQLTIIISSLMYIDKISAIIIIVVVAAFIIFSWSINRIQEPSRIEANETEDLEKANVADIFTNIESIKYFGKENLIKERFHNIATKTRDAILKNWNFFRWSVSIQQLVLGLGTFSLMYLSIRQFLNGEITIGTVTFIFTIYLSVIQNLFSFVHGMRSFSSSMVDFDSLLKYRDVTNEIKDLPDAKELYIKHGTVEFKNIDFNYKKRQMFKNFSLKIPANKKVALIGLSGAGKSTIIKLLYRFYDVDNGEILVDGKNIKEFKQESLRSELSIVPQECILFDDTITNNIAFSNPKASDEEIIKAIKFAQLDNVIKNFPEEEKTIVGERGIKLSGGEKQRVSIARAILANKKILVLDEATSSLDSETEHEIQSDLEDLMKNRTTIIIAHRLSTIMKADIIIVLDKGKVVQTGNHKELIEKKGLYKKLWNLQRGGYLK